MAAAASMGDAGVQRLAIRLPWLQQDLSFSTLLAGTATSQQTLLALHDVLLHPCGALAIGSCLRPHVLRLTSALVDKYAAGQLPKAGGSVAAFTVALVRLLELAPHIKRVVLRHLRHHIAPHQHISITGNPTVTRPVVSDGDLAFASLSALQLAPELRQQWSCANFFDLLGHSVPAVRWVAVEACAVYLNLSDCSKTQLINRQLTPEQLVDATARFQFQREAAAVELAGMWLYSPSTLDCTPEVASASKAADTVSAATATASATMQLPLPPAHGFAEVCGVELPCREEQDAADQAATSGPQGQVPSSTCISGRDHAFVHTPTGQRNLEAAALALCQGRPLLLEGPPGAGKSALLDRLAALTNNAAGIVRIHLDDQTDAKSLTGAYVCTAVPGEFAWQPGLLTQAVVEGRWAVIEDINMAPADVLAALAPLLESRTLHVPSRGQVLPAAPGFQLLATVTSAPAGAGTSAGAYGMSNMVKEMLGGLWAYVRLDAPPLVELCHILSKAYPALVPLLPTAVSMLSLMHIAAGHDRGSSSGHAGDGDGLMQAAARAALQAAGMQPGDMALHLGRHFSLRDLIKWCRRMQNIHSHLLNTKAMRKLQGMAALASLATVDTRLLEACFQEAADCFAALVAAPAARRRLLAALSSLWALVPEASADYYELFSKPAVNETGEEVQIGRAHLPRAEAVAEDFAAAQQTAARRASGAMASTSGGPSSPSTSTFARTGHAMRHMERLAVAASQREPVLLVGETGTGKTTMAAHVADLVGARLVVFNMSQQTDSSDLLGGFRPVDSTDVLAPLLRPFCTLVRRTWTKGDNDEYLGRICKYAERKKWAHLLSAFKAAVAKVTAAAAGQDVASSALDPGGATPRKRRKTTPALPPAVMRDWQLFGADVAAAERASAVADGGFAFAFAEGKLVTAVREGWWLLLDEVNLAPAEVLERISALLEDADGTNGAASITLVERGDTVQVPRHPNFRMLAAMNPATDAGKAELPAALRNRFTETWVPEPSQREDLAALAVAYLALCGPAPPVDACVDLYLAIKQAAETVLTDGAGHKPCYSLRTLCRALDYARTATPRYGLQCALYDGFSMAFLTQLSPKSAPRLEALLVHHLLGPNVKSIKALLRTPPEPPGGTHVLFEQFWLERGPLPLPEGGRDADGAGRLFVATPSVKQHLCNLARAVLIRRHPILLQGPTSSGKTSLVAYLAAQTGHHFVRINNHEHTDLQEYLGSYVGDETGRLVFREGALVRALRQGHWVVLDELNLAPSEVLEALNRLLDDNRELLVPELQEVVRPHPHFMLFATQNPPGAYAGRKTLSRAFRGRFLELHVDDIPDGELAEILERRCGIAPSYAVKLVLVMRELQRLRQGSNVFAGKHGLITPRDLFRWAERGAVGYQQLAEDGYCMLAERLRSLEERKLVAGVLERLLGAKLDMEEVYRREGDVPLQKLNAALGSGSGKLGSLAGGAAAEGLDSALGASIPATDGDAHGTAGAAKGLGMLTLSNCAAPLDAVNGAAETEALQGALRGIVWTRSMRRMYTLVDRCLKQEEPVLLVGETGTGKTTVAQLLAFVRGQRLHTLNCNLHTETADFLGGFRPARGRAAAAASLLAAAGRVSASSLFAELGIPAPAVPEEVGPMEAGSIATAVVKATAELQKQVQKRVAALAECHMHAATTGAAEAPMAKEAGRLQLQLAALLHDTAEANAAAAVVRVPFVWVDGPLVTAMRHGDMILVDEINLAEDAVLERLNSVLEPGRTLTLAERGGETTEIIRAAPGFLLLATMNPGGDFGKKELSPALSNRFTTIWVPALEDDTELLSILESRLAVSASRQMVATRLLAFWRYFQAASTPNGGSGCGGGLSVRDLLAWAVFINAAAANGLEPLAAYAHGAHLTLLDGIGLGLGVAPAAVAALRAHCQQFLAGQMPPELVWHAEHAAGRLDMLQEAVTAGHAAPSMLLPPAGTWGIAPFFVPKVVGHDDSTAAPAFKLSAPTTARNAFRVLRAMQVRKAVLLEGSPGVGKTGLVSALAAQAGQRLVRVNLSEQTDMMDLLGADLPAAGGAAGQFEWCVGPLLLAIKAGHWVLLDELNLAGQSVLEGLNALLDHRAQVFIPELGETYRCHPSFRLFAAQNPLQEGGGRKGLPRSFLNRFTRVTVELLERGDLEHIARTLYPRLPDFLLLRMVALLERLQAAANSNNTIRGSASTGTFASAGGPWEFNLRDLLRWCDLTVAAVPLPTSTSAQPAAAMDVDSAVDGVATNEAVALDEAAEHFIGMLFEHRLRTEHDRRQLAVLFADVWGRPLSRSGLPAVHLSPDTVAVGRVIMQRGDGVGASSLGLPSAGSMAGGQEESELQLLSWQVPLLESTLQALQRSWMVLLAGGPGVGKTRLARLAAQLVGVPLLELPLSAGTDTSDLLGSFEQLEPARRVEEVASKAKHLVDLLTRHLLLEGSHAQATQERGQAPVLVRSLQQAWAGYRKALLQQQGQRSVSEAAVAHTDRLTLLAPVLETCRAAVDHGAVHDTGVSKLLKDLLHMLPALTQAISTSASSTGSQASSLRAAAGRFEWVDGALTSAIEHGGWVLLDGANLCNPTVLDRLNPLLEPGGVLVLNEAGGGGSSGGGPRVIKPHPMFRLFLALDPRHGEVSRAMRNRGVELFLLPPTPLLPCMVAPTDTLATAPAEPDSDLQRLLSAEGVASPQLRSAMSAAHVAMVALCRQAHHSLPAARELCSWARLSRLLLLRGWGLSAALRAAWGQVYEKCQLFSVDEVSGSQTLVDTLLHKINPVLAADVTPGDDVAGAMDVDGQEMQHASGNSHDFQQAGALQGVESDLQDVDLAAGLNLTALQHLEPHQLPLLPPVAASAAVGRPCLWPAPASAARLASNARMATVQRDAELPHFLLGVCLTAQMHGLSAAQQLALGTLYGSTADSHHYLALIPSTQLASLLHGGTVSAVQAAPVFAQLREASTEVQVLAWLAAQCSAGRVAQCDAGLRVLWAGRLAQDLQVAAKPLLAIADGYDAGTSQLAELVPVLLRRLFEHPTTTQMISALQQFAAQAGVPASVLELQPLDLRYGALLRPYLATAADSWHSLQLLLSRWLVLQRHLAHALLQQAALSGAAAAVSSGTASPLQLSYWRFGQPQQRALRDPSHQCIDALYQVFTALLSLEEAVVGAQNALEEIPWSQPAAKQVTEVQSWRSALWEACHGVLHAADPSLASHGSSSAGSSLPQLDLLIWTWLHLLRSLDRLLVTLPSLATTPQCASLQYAAAHLSAALGVSQRPSKPLAWRLVGHPPLPSAPRLLRAQQRVQALAAALRSGPNGLQELDSKGMPSGLDAGGVNTTAILDELLAATPAGTAFGRDAEGMPTGSGMLVARRDAAAAIAAALRSDAGLKASVAQGLAMLAVLGSTPTASDSPSAAETAVGQSEGIVRSLTEEVQRRARALGRACIAAADQGGEEWLAVQGAADSVAASGIFTAAFVGSKARLDLSASASLLPAAWMVSSTCRQLQQGLLPLQDMHAVASQVPLLAACSLVSVGWSLPAPLPETTALVSRLRDELPAAAAAAAASGRSPADSAPQQQLLWVLEALCDAGAPQHSSSLHTILHEMWYRWHDAVWNSSALMPSSSAPANAAGAHNAESTTLPPALLYQAVQTHVVSHLLHAFASDVQTKVVRLAQLRLAARRLQLSATAAALCSSVAEAPSSTRIAATWFNLACLLCQLLEAHGASLPSNAARAELAGLLQQVLQSAASNVAGGPAVVAPALTAGAHQAAFLAQLASLVRLSDHQVLLQLLEPLVLPCLAAVLVGLSQQGRQPHLAAMWAHGRVWLLLGALRLHLVSPPPGVDPAGKYGLKRLHLLGRLANHVVPEMRVRAALLRLPGGPDEGPCLADLATERDMLVSHLRIATARCVPRPALSQYLPLQQEVAAFSKGLGSVERVQHLTALVVDAAPAFNHTSASSVEEVVAWQANVGAWAERLGRQYPLYCDLVQPVQLATLEMRHGAALLAAAAAPRATYVARGDVDSGTQLHKLTALVAGLLAFPAVLQHRSVPRDGAELQLAPTTALGDEDVLLMLQRLAGAASRRQLVHLPEEKAASAADLASYNMRLRAGRTALLATARELLVMGPAGLATCGKSLASFARLDALLASFVSSWRTLRAYEEEQAAQEASLFKTKATSAVILSEEEESERDYLIKFPDHFAAFKDIVGADDMAYDENGAPRDLAAAADADAAAAEAAARAAAAADAAGGAGAGAARARSSAAQQLLDGVLLVDIVSVHNAVYTALLQQTALVANTDLCSAEATRRAFLMAYSLGTELAENLRGDLSAELDEVTCTGHLYRLSLEHAQLSRAPAATGAAAAVVVSDAAAITSKARSAHAMKGTKLPTEHQNTVDMQAPCVEEVTLLQEPVAAVDHRLRCLLEEFPEHPLLTVLQTICQRLLSLPLTSPLKAALTGLELLLAKAQVWEETAAQHVSIKTELSTVAALATRWRRLELASWRGLLRHVAERHARGASRSWFHLYRLLLEGGPAGVAGVHVTGDLHLEGDAPATAGMAAPPECLPASPGEAAEQRYRQIAATLEHFLQTSTQGEFGARLSLLTGFRAHLLVRHVPAACHNVALLDELLAAAIANTHAYYAQFAPAVEQSLAAGMVPIEKDLQDFVALAKWEDRGFYSLRAATEKAQRYLHRLTRRGETVLAEPVARVLAAATKSMGVTELVAPGGAAAAREAAIKAAKERPSLRPTGIVPITPNAAAAVTGLEAAELAAGGSASEQHQEEDNRAWAAYCAAVFTQPPTSAAPPHPAPPQLSHLTPPTPATTGTLGSSVYLTRLPQLTLRLAKVLTTAMEGGQALPQVTDAPAAVLLVASERVDDLAVSAAQRSMALRDDVAKGARARKKKALVDFLKALQGLGVSRRQADIPSGDREVTSWFKHSPPELGALLATGQPGGSLEAALLGGCLPAPASALALLSGAGCFGKADTYYFRAIARVQKFWRAAQQPHKDVSLQEVLISRRLIEHMLFTCRQQRDLIRDAATAHTALTRSATSLAALAQRNVTGSTDKHAGADVGDISVPPQRAGKLWLARQKRCLDSLSVLLADTQQLLQACVGTAAVPAHESALKHAAGAMAEASMAICLAKDRLDTELVKLREPIPAAQGSASAGLEWVSRSAWRALSVNYTTLEAVLAKLQATFHTMPATGTATAAVASMPGVQRVVLELTVAVCEADEFAAVAGEAHEFATAAAAGTAQLAPAPFLAAVEDTIKSLLLWAQGGLKATRKLDQVPGNVAAAAAATVVAEAGEDAEDGFALPQAMAVLRDMLRVGRANDIAAGVRDLLVHLSTARDAGNVDSATHVAAMAEALSLLAPALALASGALKRHMLRALVLHKATAKLAYISASVLATLVEDGFCVPDDGKEGEPGGEGDDDGYGKFQPDEEGTGMGDGKGRKDVSDKITDEDQLLGAEQKEKPKEPEPPGGPEEEEEGGNEDRSKGIEMEQDFDGVLEDVPMDADERNRSSEDEEGDDDHIDQQMGDVGDNEEVVDEKLWGDDDDDKPPGEEGQKKEEKYERDAPIKVNDKKDLEYMGGKEGEDNDKKDKMKPDDAMEKPSGHIPPEQARAEDEGDQAEDEEGGVNEDADDKYEDHHNAAKPQTADEELQLPEDLALDGGETGGEEDEKPQENDKDGVNDQAEPETGQEEMPELPAVPMDEEAAGGADAEEGKEAEAPADASVPNVEEPPEQSVAGGQPEEDGGVGEEPPADEEAAQPATAHGAGDEPPPVPQVAGPKGLPSAAPASQAESTGQARGNQAKLQAQAPQPGDDSGRQQQQSDAGMNQDTAPEAAPQVRQALDMGASGASERGAPTPLAADGAGDQQPPPAAQQRRRQSMPEPNPLRNLGDALERWRANLVVNHEAPAPAEGDGEAAQHDTDAQEDADSALPPAATEYQYLGAGEARREGDTQALAPATEEQACSLEQAVVRDEHDGKEEDRGDEAAGLADDDMADADGSDDAKATDMMVGQAPQQWAGGQRSAKVAPRPGQEDVDLEEKSEADGADGMGKDGDAGVAGSEAGAGGEALPSMVAARLASTVLAEAGEGGAGDELAHVGLTPEQTEEVRKQLDERLAAASASAAMGGTDPSADAQLSHELWARCEALTAGLASELTEQLRLILEPTLASKLTGDYRTGKRINMRKVIQYIASHFRKDKIWMRRNRPDKRRYQVLLAVDDSRSMAENGCGGVALEAMTLICRAMSRLEVGSVGVVKFGGASGAVPLLPLGGPPFSDAAGPGLVGQMRFDADNTIADQPVLQLVEGVNHILDVARHQAGAGGVGAGTQDLHQLVLILADGRFHEKEGLRAAVREAAAKRGVCLAFIALDNPKSSLADMQTVSFVGGKPTFSRYLDEFPFPYYILLRDIAALPRTLADLLRQWFELSSMASITT